MTGPEQVVHMYNVTANKFIEGGRWRAVMFPKDYILDMNEWLPKIYSSTHNFCNVCSSMNIYN